jgi:septal ring-binding cell division protein DamX
MPGAQVSSPRTDGGRWLSALGWAPMLLLGLCAVAIQMGAIVLATGLTQDGDVSAKVMAEPAPAPSQPKTGAVAPSAPDLVDAPGVSSGPDEPGIAPLIGFDAWMRGALVADAVGGPGAGVQAPMGDVLVEDMAALPGVAGTDGEGGVPRADPVSVRPATIPAGAAPQLAAAALGEPTRKPPPSTSEPRRQASTRAVWERALAQVTAGAAVRPDQAWLAGLAAEQYTLQLIAVRDPARIERFLATHPVPAPYAVYTTWKGAKYWYAVVHGAFDSRGEAQAAAQVVKGELGVDAWIRRLAEIRADMDRMPSSAAAGLGRGAES